MVSKLHTVVTIFLLLNLILSISGCSTRAPLTKEDPSQWSARSKIFIVLADGREYAVMQPSLTDSKLRGTFSPDDRQEVELAEIESMSVRQIDKARTIGLAVWALTATVILIILQGDENSGTPCPT